MAKAKTYTLLQKERSENQTCRLNLEVIREQAKTFDRERLLFTCILMCEEIEALRKLAKKPEGIWLQLIGEPLTSESPDGSAFTEKTLQAYGFTVVSAKKVLEDTGQNYEQLTLDQIREQFGMFEQFEVGECYLLVGESDQEAYMAIKANEKFKHPETW